MSGPFRGMLIIAFSVVVIGCLLGVFYSRFGVPGEFSSPSAATPPVKVAPGSGLGSGAAAAQPEVEKPGATAPQEGAADGSAAPPEEKAPQGPVGPEAPKAPPSETTPAPSQPEQPAQPEPAPPEQTTPAPEQPAQPAAPPSGGVNNPDQPSSPETPSPNPPGNGDENSPSEPDNPIISNNSLQLVSWYTTNGHEVHIVLRDLDRSRGARTGTLNWELTTAGGTKTSGSSQFMVSPFNKRDTDLFLVRYIRNLSGQNAHILLHFRDNKGLSDFWCDVWMN